MSTIVIEVSVPQSADIEAAAAAVDVVADPGGAQVIVVPAPGPPGPAGPPGEGTRVVGETPAGVKNGINTIFTLAHPPQTGSVSVYRNGLREVAGVGFTVSGTTLTFTTPPLSSDDTTVDYVLEG